MEVFLSVSEDSWRPIRVFPRGSLQGIADTCCCCDWHWCRSLLCLAATPWCGHKPLFGNIQSLCSQPAFVNADVQRMGGAGMSSWGFLQRPWCTLCQEKAMLMPSFWKQYFIACGYLSISLFSRLPYNTVLLFFLKKGNKAYSNQTKRPEFAHWWSIQRSFCLHFEICESQESCVHIQGMSLATAGS